MVSVSISVPVVFIFISIIFSRTTLSEDQYEESQAIKTFQNKYGDVYDCVDIYKQPSLNHPMLKNHKIQMWPTSKHMDRKGLKNTCPKGTVPIRRLSSTQHSSGSSPNRNVSFYATRQFAGIKTKSISSKSYYGASAIVSIYKPKVKVDQMSGVVISLHNGGDQAFSTRIEAGWMVNPSLYGDTNARLYISWTVDGGYRTGCYNTNCPGFILINSKIPIDFVLNETTVGVTKRVQMVLQIFKDDVIGNWWLVFGRKNAVIGYWPKELVPNLVNGAQVVQMGGIVSSSHESTPPMGSGYDFIEIRRWNFYNSAFFAQIQFIDKSYLPFGPLHGEDALIDLVWERCYMTTGVFYYVDKVDGYSYVFGYSFAFGGRGGDDYKCPSSLWKLKMSKLG